MSNTAPAYLEGFQRIVMSVDEISGPDDIKHFVNDHKDLTVSPTLPEFERHPFITGEAVSCSILSLSPIKRNVFTTVIFIVLFLITR